MSSRWPWCCSASNSWSRARNQEAHSRSLVDPVSAVAQGQQRPRQPAQHRGALSTEPVPTPPSARQVQVQRPHQGLSYQDERQQRPAWVEEVPHEPCQSRLPVCQRSQPYPSKNSERILLPSVTLVQPNGPGLISGPRESNNHVPGRTVQMFSSHPSAIGAKKWGQQRPPNIAVALPHQSSCEGGKTEAAERWEAPALKE